MPRTGRDSIWICWIDAAGERLVNPATRHAAKTLLAEWLATAMSRNARVLMGFDFPFGYPAGFAARLGLSGPPWRAVWDEIARLVSDDEHNLNNRFDVAAALNEAHIRQSISVLGMSGSLPAALPRTQASSPSRAGWIGRAEADR